MQFGSALGAVNEVLAGFALFYSGGSFGGAANVVVCVGCSNHLLLLLGHLATTTATTTDMGRRHGAVESLCPALSHLIVQEESKVASPWFFVFVLRLGNTVALS